MEVENRRYMGSKAKLTPWIMKIIEENTEDAHSFCDIFSGTGVVAKYAIPQFDKVIINDFSSIKFRNLSSLFRRR